MKRRRFDHINVVPFIDVMLVLLAIVLTTASFISFQQMRVILPQTQNQTPAESLKQPLEIGINAQGQFLLQNTGQSSPGLVSLEQLKAQLSTVKPQQQILIQADAQSPFTAFVQLLEILDELGLQQQSSILTQAR